MTNSTAKAQALRTTVDRLAPEFSIAEGDDGDFDVLDKNGAKLLRVYICRSRITGRTRTDVHAETDGRLVTLTEAKAIICSAP